VPWSASRPGSSPIYRTPQHRKARAALLAAYQPGDPCCLCGRPMYGPTRNLHADHDPHSGGYRGLAHGGPPYWCNQRDGSRRARARQDASRLRW
jgi:hypothetical protein